MTTAVPRILVTTSTFPRWQGDTEPAFVFDLCLGLQRLGLQVDVLAPHASGAKPRETMAGMQVHRYRYFFTRLQSLAYNGGILANLRRNPLNYLLVPLMLLSQAVALHRLLKSADYHVVHAHWIIPQGLIAAIVLAVAGPRTPVLICTSHGGDLFALNNRLFSVIKRWVLARCAHFCVVSSAMRRQAIERFGIPEKKTSVMPMGVDLVNRFVPVPDIPRGNSRLIFVGRLVEKKGVPVLLAAMPLVIREVPDAELLIVGEGPLRSSLEHQVAGSGLSARVRFYGSASHQELPRLYSSAAIAVVPSIVAASGDQEGLGLVIVEALGCGCAVVASSLDAIRDVLDHEDCLARPGDASDLAGKIISLLKNSSLQRERAEQGREEALLRFDQRVVSAGYFQLILATEKEGSQ